jgi:hypothetical protein
MEIGGAVAINDDKIVPLGTVPEPRVIDFRHFDRQDTPMAVPAPLDKNNHALSTTRRQLRHRIRRGALDAKASNGQKAKRVEKEIRLLYKPIEEWDSEELARGRPRNVHGNFSGPAPKWISRELHEEAITRFRQALRDELQSSSVRAVDVINMILEDDEIDVKGRPRTPMTTKLEAAKFLVEHILGKPKQHVETDISVKLQGILASAIITPGTLPAQLGSAEQASPRSAEEFGFDTIDVPGFEDDDE